MSWSLQYIPWNMHTVFALLCFVDLTLTDFPILIRLTSLALWQSNDCPSASKATLMNMDEYFMWIHYERLHNHNKAKHNKTVCIFIGIYCTPVILAAKWPWNLTFELAQYLPMTLLPCLEIGVWSSQRYLRKDRRSRNIIGSISTHKSTACWWNYVMNKFCTWNFEIRLTLNRQRVCHSLRKNTTNAFINTKCISVDIYIYVSKYDLSGVIKALLK